MIEIDITSPSINKLPIYVQLGIPEVWRYDGRKLAILTLEGAEYEEVGASAALPPLTSTALNSFVKQSMSTKRTVWLRSLREWARLQSG